MVSDKTVVKGFSYARICLSRGVRRCCHICGETVERLKTDEEGYQIHHYHPSGFCDYHNDDIWGLYPEPYGRMWRMKDEITWNYECHRCGNKSEHAENCRFWTARKELKEAVKDE